jgi:hypothetical protein
MADQVWRMDDGKVVEVRDGEGGRRRKRHSIASGGSTVSGSES